MMRYINLRFTLRLVGSQHLYDKLISSAINPASQPADVTCSRPLRAQ